MEQIRLKKKPQDWGDVSPLFGYMFHTLDGTPFSRGDPIPHERNAMLFSDKAVVGDMIPMASWGSSLANLLTQKSWDALRHPLIAQNHSVCECCGLRYPTLDVHEIWSYTPPTDKQNFGKQKLEGLMTVCKDCHELFHPGLAKERGRLPAVSRRLKAINGWTDADLSAYFDLVAARFDRHNQFIWALDFSGLAHPDGILTISSKWQRMDTPVFGSLLVSKNRFGNTPNVTRIDNIGWRLVQQ